MAAADAVTTNEQEPSSPKLDYSAGGHTSPTDPGYVRSGNRIVVLFGGKLVGLVQSVQLADDYGIQAANRLGSIESAELIPLEATHTITVSLMMLSKDTLYNTGKGTTQTSETVLIPHSGVDPTNRTGNTSAINGKELDIVVHSIREDGSLGDVLASYTRCVYASGTVDVSANRLTVSNATFRAVHRSGDFFDH